MGTIVQDYGPIYGEVVNGTVQGRPNGSVYVPSSNVITAVKMADGTPTVSRSNPGQPTRVYSSIQIKIDAIAQDLSSNIAMGLFTDSDCTVPFGSKVVVAAGVFILNPRTHVANSTDSPEEGTTYYFRAFLMNNNSPVAASEIIEVEGA